MVSTRKNVLSALCLAACGVLSLGLEARGQPSDDPYHRAWTRLADAAACVADQALQKPGGHEVAEHLARFALIISPESKQSLALRQAVEGHQSLNSQKLNEGLEARFIETVTDFAAVSTKKLDKLVLCSLILSLDPNHATAKAGLQQAKAALWDVRDENLLVAFAQDRGVALPRAFVPANRRGQLGGDNRLGFQVPDALRGTVLIKRDDGGFGSGVILAHDGLIATNYHVVRGSRAVVVELKDGRCFEVAELLGTADLLAKDVAFLRIPALGLTTLGWSEPSEASVGAQVACIGHPHGHKWTFSKGFVAGVREELGRSEVQISADVSSGNSGGPVLNSSGEVIGLVTSLERQQIRWSDGKITVDPSGILKFGVSTAELAPYLRNRLDLREVKLARLAVSSAKTDAGLLLGNLNVVTFSLLSDLRHAIKALRRSFTTTYVKKHRKLYTDHHDRRGRLAFSEPYQAPYSKALKRSVIHNTAFFELVGAALLELNARREQMLPQEPADPALKQACLRWTTCVEEGTKSVEQIFGAEGESLENSDLAKARAFYHLDQACYELRESLGSLRVFFRRHRGDPGLSREAGVEVDAMWRECEQYSQPPRDYPY